ncbi:hypothetical protein KSP39_PZI008311 [Platanthera zijinensis]|uniref:Protein TILLER ANGLE CONTROL 1 n=1 Tax=Platanthera zijinensis TaxID=2320716 RepID=A0AAP0BMJ9_9ASPA
MLILDWMHRRLHPVGSNYTRLATRKASAFEEDAGKITVVVHNSDQSAAEIEHYTEASLLHHELEGILSIGTLGHSHPSLLPHHFPEEDEDDDELKLESPKTEPMVAEKPPVRIPLLQTPVEMFMVETEPSGRQLVVADLAEEKIMTEVPLLKEDREKKAERTTLADLLLAESPSTGDDPPAAIAGAIKNAISVQSISCASTSSLKSSNKEKMKLIKQNKEDRAETSHSSAAAKRIRRMITRMVKKKIHPVAEAGAEVPGRNDGGAPAIGVNRNLLSHGGGAA